MVANCKEENCFASVRCKGLCSKHYFKQFDKARGRDKYDRDRSMTPANKSYRARWVKKNPRRTLESRLRCRYGLSIDKYNEMLTAQCNCCLLCGELFDEENIPVIDHNHVTGDVRALLHRGCNLGLGAFKDNPEVLEKAAYYLRRFRDVGL